MRRRYRWCDQAKALIEVIPSAPQSVAPFIHPDLPGYQSPVTGKWIDGKRQRRDDLARTGSRPYEGRVVETQIAKSYQESQDRQLDRDIEKKVVDVWQHSPERIRRVFK